MKNQKQQKNKKSIFKPIPFRIRQKLILIFFTSTVGLGLIGSFLFHWGLGLVVLLAMVLAFYVSLCPPEMSVDDIQAELLKKMGGKDEK